MSTHGIHHVTAIAGDAKKNYDFYTQVLALRMVKKTVNFDDPYTYHFYFGDKIGSPGTIITFFPWSSLAHRGRHGTGQMSVTAFSIPANSVSFWLERFKKHDVPYDKPYQRFDEEVITFRDPDGLKMELVAVKNDTREGFDGIVSAENAIKGFYGVSLSVQNHPNTISLMTGLLGFKQLNEKENRFRLSNADNKPGSIVDVLSEPDKMPGSMGAGIVHHVAWRLKDDQTQEDLRNKLYSEGYNVSPVMNRNYFRSIYFREPGGILFEGATDAPGFLIDEDEKSLGQDLKLPEWYEAQRNDIEKALPRLD